MMSTHKFFNNHDLSEEGHFSAYEASGDTLQLEISRLRAVPLRAVLTRPRDRQVDLMNHLRSKAWDVLGVPALELAPLTEPAFANTDRPQSHDWVMFVSRTAWQIYWKLIGERWPSNVRIAVVGLGTASEVRRDLADAGIEILTPMPPAQQDSEALWELLQPRLQPGARVLIVAGRDGRTWMRDHLQTQGAHARILNVYERRVASITKMSVDTLEAWSENSITASAGVWLMTSQHGILSVRESLNQHHLLGKISPAAVLVTHPRLKALAKDFLDQTRAHKNAPVLVSGPDSGSLKRAFDMIQEAIRSP